MANTFKSQYKVTIGDINYGGHLGNERPLTVFHNSRIEFLNSLGLSELDIGEARGIILVESGVKYLREIFLHNELEVEISVAELRAKKFTLQYTIVRKPEDEMVVTGFTSFLAFDYSSRKVAKLPDSFFEKMAIFKE